MQNRGNVRIQTRFNAITGEHIIHTETNAESFLLAR